MSFDYLIRELEIIFAFLKKQVNLVDYFPIMSGSLPTWTILGWALVFAGIGTDFWWGRFDTYGVQEKRPLQDPTKDRWPKKKPE